MANRRLLGYGSWRSPITSDLIVAETVGLGQLKTRGEELFWVESRPSEGGRNVVVRRGIDGAIRDVNVAPFNARTRVYEYGGGAYVVAPGQVFLTGFQDQGLHIAIEGSAPQPLTRAERRRFADGIFDPTLGRIICVCEDHTTDATEPRHTLVSVHAQSGDMTPLVEGADFYASPKLSPDRRQLAWIAWSHPDMPWDASALWVADLESNGSLTNARKLAGGDAESIFQPEWSPDGALYFISDRSGWWNLWRWTGEFVEPVLQVEAEFGRPQWALGLSTYGFVDTKTLVCAFVEKGFWRMGRLDVGSGRLDRFDLPYSAIADLRTTPTRAVLIASAPGLPNAVVTVDLETGTPTVVRSSSTHPPDPKYISMPEPVEFPTTAGRTAHALFYPPKNDDYSPPQGELPPVIVKVHGGPTAASSPALNLNTQFWTSRGFAVLDVNYGGSSGYGRAYRDRLKHSWGIVDLDDCANAALHMARTGRVDRQRMAISGGSAGGYTVMCALAFRDGVFQAGTSYYGISDLKALLRDTHKFESRYTHWLIGPPQDDRRYHDRSPLHFADRIGAPVLFLQGEEDRVVPPNQTEMMAQALLDRGRTFGLIMFAGEQHGFRKADTIRRALDAELSFYALLLTGTGLRA